MLTKKFTGLSEFQLGINYAYVQRDLKIGKMIPLLVKKLPKLKNLLIRTEQDPD
jgi:hypothetical protein